MGVDSNLGGHERESPIPIIEIYIIQKLELIEWF